LKSKVAPYSLAAVELFVHILAIADADDQHDPPCILEFADDAKIAHPVPPWAELVSAQRLAKIARIVGLGNPFLEVIEYFRTEND
jgi:hypothetical protein